MCSAALFRFILMYYDEGMTKRVISLTLKSQLA